METRTLEQIPEDERKYWNIGETTEAPVTQATAPKVWQDYLSLHKQGNWLQALIAINGLIDYDRNQPEVWRVKARLHGVMGHSASCMCAIQALLKLVPDDLDALRMQAMFLYCHNSHDNALSICDSVLINNPSQADFWALKGDILSSRGELEAAQRACKQALSLKPDCIAALRLQNNLQASL